MTSKRTKTLRLTTMAAVVTLVVGGAILNVGTGTLSALGVKNISAVCPLGYLETALAGRDIMPPLLVCFLAIALLTVLLGRVFCGWICPVPLTRSLLINETEEKPARNASDAGLPEDGKKAKISCRQHDGKKKFSPGLPVLGITLASSAICGFPVFCLICPIGLIFATLFALVRLIRFNEPTFDLIIFPVVIIVELVILKRWCSALCPVGALLSLFSRFNRTLVPAVDRSLCLEESRGIKCQRCRSACSFDVDIKNGSATSNISACIKCKECSDACPVDAIRFPWRKTA